MTDTNVTDVGTTAIETTQNPDVSNTDATSNEVPKTEVQKRKYKFKVDAEDKELDLDDTEISTYLSKAHGADKRFREASDLQKEVVEFVKGMKSDPMPYLKKLGIDIKTLAKQAGISAKDLLENPKQWAEDLLLEHLQEETATPEQKRLRELERKFEELHKKPEDKKEPEVQKPNEQEMQAAQEQAAAEIQDQVIKAIEASGMKATPRLVLKIVTEMISEIDSVGVIPDAGKTLARARKQAQEDAIDLLSSLANDSDLLSALPQPLLARIRKAMMEQVKSEGKVPQQRAAVTPQREKRRYKTMSEIFD